MPIPSRGSRPLALVFGAVLAAACGETPATPPADVGPDDARSETPDVAVEGSDAALPLADAALLPRTDAAPPLADAGRTGAGLFAHGCPVAGRASARLLTGGDDRLTGPAALGDAGDALLANDRAAFVIQAPDALRTYWYYGGGLIDAAAVADCAQASPEKFGEVALLVARLDLQDFPQSVLRGFRGERMEIVADGRDGQPARVRVHGHDDRFWLVEFELIRRVVQGGGLKTPSGPFGLDVYVDYVLPPDASVLQIETHLVNPTAEVRPYQTATALFLADETENYAMTRTDLSLGGLNLGLQMPWLVAESREGSYALALESAQQGTTNISGTDVLVDLTQAAAGALKPAAGGGEAMRRMFVSVGAGAADTAVGPLAEVLGFPRRSVVSRLVAAGSNSPQAGVLVRAEAETAPGVWKPFDSTLTNLDGEARFELWDAGASLPMRLRAVSAGENAPLSVPADDLPADGRLPDLVVSAPGRLEVAAVDADGAPLPAHVTLERPDAPRLDFWTLPGVVEAPAGTYDFAVTRGFEHAPFRGTVTLRAGETTHLDAPLPRVVDTRGFLSLDTHVHAAPSPDSRVSLVDRALNAAGVGLEVMISTDHEFVADWRPGIEAAGVGAFVRTFPGEEVTATTPEHTTMYPVPLQPDARRGGFVLWYDMGLGEIFAAERDRGAGIRGLNHPRGGCNWLCLIDWDRIAGAPHESDPTRFGLPAEASLWSWDFEQVEYMNGQTPVFANAARPDETGLFEDWMSFLNHGHRITAMGVTDEHGQDSLGSPRTYFESPTDDPAAVDEAALVAAIREGRAQVSTGAFARVAIGDAGPGDTVTLPAGAGTLQVHLEALPEVDVTRFKVFANCDEVAEVAATAPDEVVKFDGEVPLALPADAHIVVAALGEARFGLGLPDFDPTGIPRVTTNAIYVDADGDGLFTPPGGKACAYAP